MPNTATSQEFNASVSGAHTAVIDFSGPDVTVAFEHAAGKSRVVLLSDVSTHHRALREDTAAINTPELDKVLRNHDQFAAARFHARTPECSHAQSLRVRLA